MLSLLDTTVHLCVLQDVEQPLHSIRLNGLSSWLAQRKGVFTNAALHMPPFTWPHMKHIICLFIKWITISSVLTYSFHAVQTGEQKSGKIHEGEMSQYLCF